MANMTGLVELRRGPESLPGGADGGRVLIDLINAILITICLNVFA